MCLIFNRPQKGGDYMSSCLCFLLSSFLFFSQRNGSIIHDNCPSKLGEVSPDKIAGDDSGPKRIVHKIRSDVKGIRNAIRSRSRAGRRSGESLELQALAGERTSSDGKVLRRMPRVESDDSQQPHHQEDREEKFSKQRHSTSSISSPPPTQPTPSTSSAPEGETEVIGAGLPLLQRLLILKAKEEKDKNTLTPLNSNQASSSDTISPSSIKSPLSPTIKTLSPIRKCSESSSPGKLQSPTAKTSRKNSSGSNDGTSRPKVSFRDKILQVQSDGTAVCQPLSKDVSEKPAAVVEPTPKTESHLISIPHSVVSKIKSPAKSVGSTFRDKLKLLQSGTTSKEPESKMPAEKIKPFVDKPLSETSQIQPVETENKNDTKTKKPWTKLKKAAILGDTKKGNKSTLEENKDVDNTAKEENKVEASVNISVPVVTTAELVKIDNNNIEVDSDNVKSDKPTICLTSPLEPVQEKSLDLLTLSPKQNNIVETSDTKTATIIGTPTLLPKDKKYKSIDDLSPEYGGLPFVKKLKILNERQKLAELEKVVKFRSSSLDCASSSEDLLCDTLTRSLSEGSTMDKRKYKRKSITSIDSQGSNETLERRTLKSILKKLSEDVTPAESPERSNELKRLIRAPTIEGYAARHSKFSKSVTFHRHTLQSPPSSAPSDTKGTMFHMPDITVPLSDSNTTPTGDTSITAAEIECTTVELRTSNIDNVVTTVDTSITPEYELQQNIDPMYDLKCLRPEEIKMPSEKSKLTLLSAVANQKKLLRGSLEEQEYFGEVLLGIKQIIQGHLHDVQGKFQDRFNSLENEVKKRDEIISQLQNRIQELERLGLSRASPTTQQTEIVNDISNNGEENTGSTNQSLAKNDSSGSDISGIEEGFMRGDSLDTVFATSPPTLSVEENDKDNTEKTSTVSSQKPDEEISEKKLAQMTEGIELRKLSYSELQSLADTLSNRADKTSSSKAEWTISKSKRLDLNLDGKAGTYSRKRAAKLRQRKSWEDQSDQETVELQDLTRPMSPQTTSEDRSLLSPEQSSLRTSRRGIHPFHFFGTHLDSTKSKIKKTLSVDTGMHHTGRKEPKIGHQRQHRKFSLGSFFSRGTPPKPPQNCNDVVLDIGSDYSWSDTTSTSSNSDSESLPRTPAFEEFVESSTRRGRTGSLSISSPIRELSSCGGDWEVMMLAEELEKREREKEREESRRHHYSTTLRELEEESDTPQRDDSLDEYSNNESNSSSTTHLLSQSTSEPSPRSLETTFTERSSRGVRQHRVGSVGEPIRPQSSLRQSRGLILRAASLDRETTPAPTQTGRFGSLKSYSTDSHKRL